MHETDADATPQDVWARETAPQSPYSTRQVVIGLVVLAIGLLVVFGLPLGLI